MEFRWLFWGIEAVLWHIGTCLGALLMQVILRYRGLYLYILLLQDVLGYIWLFWGTRAV